MPNKVPDSDSERDANWFLEAIGATPPPPTGSEAIDELTRENDIATPPDGDVDNTIDTPPSPSVPDVYDELAMGNAEIPAVTDEDTPPESIDAQGTLDIEQREPQPPSPKELTPATTPLMQTTQITMSSFDGNPGTTNAAFALSPGRRTAAIPTPPPLPEPATSPEGESDVTADAAAATVGATVDEALSRPLRSSRSFRWPVIVILVLLIAAVGVAAIFVPRAAEAEALAVRQNYYDVTSEVRNYIPEAQVALDSITDETADIVELSASIPRIIELDSRSFTMQETAAEPLPSTLPFVPTAAIDALVPLHDTTAALGEDGSDLARRLGNAYFYRVAIPGLLQTGNLPTAATTETINEISVTLAGSLADDAASVAQLPDDAIFGDVQALAETTHERYATWQVEYLESLTSEDRGSAETLVAEIDAMRFALAEANTVALAAFRSEFDVYIVSYAGELDIHMANLSRG